MVTIKQKYSIPEEWNYLFDKKVLISIFNNWDENSVAKLTKITGLPPTEVEKALEENAVLYIRYTISLPEYKKLFPRSILDPAFKTKTITLTPVDTNSIVQVEMEIHWFYRHAMVELLNSRLYFPELEGFIINEDNLTNSSIVW